MFVQNYAAGPSWVAGTIVAVHGPLSFDVKLRDGIAVKCHIDHVRSRTVVPSRDTVGGSNTEDVSWLSSSVSSGSGDTSVTCTS